MIHPEAIPPILFLTSALFSSLILYLVLFRDVVKFDVQHTRASTRRLSILATVSVTLFSVSVGSIELAAWAYPVRDSQLAKLHVAEAIMGVLLKFSLAVSVLYLSLLCSIPPPHPYPLYKLFLPSFVVCSTFLSVLAILLPSIPLILSPVLSLVVASILLSLPLVLLAGTSHAIRKSRNMSPPSSYTYSMWHRKDIPLLLLLAQVTSVISSALSLIEIHAGVVVGAHSSSNSMSTDNAVQITALRALSSFFTVVSILAVQTSFRLHCRPSLRATLTTCPVPIDPIPDFLDLRDPFASPPQLPRHSCSFVGLDFQRCKACERIYYLRDSTHFTHYPSMRYPRTRGAKRQDSTQSLISPSFTGTMSLTGTMSSYPPSPLTASFPVYPYPFSAQMGEAPPPSSTSTLTITAMTTTTTTTTDTEETEFDPSEAILSRMLLKILTDKEAAAAQGERVVEMEDVRPSEGDVGAAGDDGGEEARSMSKALDEVPHAKHGDSDRRSQEGP